MINYVPLKVVHQVLNPSSRTSLCQTIYFTLTLEFRRLYLVDLVVPTLYGVCCSMSSLIARSQGLWGHRINKDISSSIYRNILELIFRTWCFFNDLSYPRHQPERYPSADSWNNLELVFRIICFNCAIYLLTEHGLLT